MNESEHQELRTALGAYALGHLEPAERARLEEHLDGCAACTADLAEVAPAAAALARVRRDADRGAAPPPDLGDRVLGAVHASAARDRRRRVVRLSTATGLAAAAALVVVAGTLALTREDAPAGPTVPLEAVPVQVQDRAVTASADLVDHTWGVEVKLTGTGFDRGGDYRVDVLGSDGTRYPAGGFVGTGAREMDCNLNSSVLRERAAGFEVVDAAGTVVVSSTF